jgi:acyl carrier protein
MIVTHQEIMAMLQNGEFSLDTKKLTHDAPLRRIGLDSLDASLFFLNVQEKYGIAISDDEVAQLDTVNDIVAWLNERLA